MNTQAIWELVKNTFNEWSEDKAPRLAAALAYYTVFAIAPILVIAIAVAKLFGFSGAQDEIVAQVSSVVGQQAGEAIRTMVENRGQSNSTNILATTVGVITLLVAATGLFGELQDSLNTIWEVQPKPNQGIMATLKNRVESKVQQKAGAGAVAATEAVVRRLITYGKRGGLEGRPAPPRNLFYNPSSEFSIILPTHQYQPWR